MARKVIKVGSKGNDGAGESIRDAFVKINDNFQELYSRYSSVQGIQGIQGITSCSSSGPGSRGIQGTQGIFGVQGHCGRVGPQGTQGIQGLQGRCGLQGLHGSQGVQGPAGAGTDSGGLQGIQGIYGTQGTCGIQGRQGTQGTIGVQGIQGLQGRQGLQGLQGLQGTQSTQGLQGTQGFQGPAGAGCGSLGSQGTQGLQGAQGVQGTQGLQGRQGTQGLQGRCGFQGLQGNCGSQGVQGPAGAGIDSGGLQGIQGIQGSQGICGIQGRQGTQGLLGRQGLQGIQGIYGDVTPAALAAKLAAESARDDALAAAAAAAESAAKINSDYPTVAAMKADPNLVVGQYTRTLGYYSAGDGGETSYEIVPANTGTNDGGNYININNGLQAKAIFSGNRVRLSQFGAKGKYSYTSTPLSVGGWINPEPGAFYLDWNGVSTYSPLTFSTVIGGSYILNLFRLSALKPVSTYDLQLVHGAGGTGNSIGNIAGWARPLSSAVFTAKNNYVSLLPIGTSPLSVKFKDVIFYRIDDDINALNAALTYFADKSGTLVIDTCSYFNITTAGITIPKNINLEFSNPGIMAFNTKNKTLTINSFITADDRPIFPKYSSVTLSPMQTTIKKSWFGV